MFSLAAGNGSNATMWADGNRVSAYRVNCPRFAPTSTIVRRSLRNGSASCSTVAATEERSPCLHSG